MGEADRTDTAFQAGLTVGERSHSELSSGDIDAVTATVDAIETALERRRHRHAADLALVYWDGYVTGGLDAPGTDADERLEQAFDAGLLGMDLYQRLRGLRRALADDRPLEKWVERVLDVTRDERGHLETHR